MCTKIDQKYQLRQTAVDTPMYQYADHGTETQLLQRINMPIYGRVDYCAESIF